MSKPVTGIWMPAKISGKSILEQEYRATRKIKQWQRNKPGSDKVIFHCCLHQLNRYVATIQWDCLKFTRRNYLVTAKKIDNNGRITWNWTVFSIWNELDDAHKVLVDRKNIHNLEKSQIETSLLKTNSMGSCWILQEIWNIGRKLMGKLHSS